MNLLQIAVISNILYFVSSYVIGVDLGTTFSCVGVMERGKVEIIPNASGNRVTPSIVSFTDQEILVGDEIYEYGNPFVVNPNNTIYQTKRMIGRKYDEQIQKYFQSFPFQVKNGTNSEPVIACYYQAHAHEHTPTQIASMILTQIQQTAAAYLGREPTDAIVTVPAYFTDEQREATKQAASDAGLNALRIINEPIAAAIAYGLDKRQNEALFLVYDLGGSTLDVTLLELDEGVFEVLSTTGEHIGGNNFDERLVDHFVKVFKRKHNIDISNNQRAKATLRTELEKAKRALSSTTHVRIEIEEFVDNIDLSETLTRARFEELNNDLFRNTIKSIEAVLKDAGVKKSEVNEIVLSGGSTRIPKIPKLVTDFFNGKEPQRGIHPDEVVAYGASVQAAILDSYRQSAYTYHGGSNSNYPCYSGCVELNEQSVDININNNYALITYSFEFENMDNKRDSQIQYEMSIDSGAYISHFIGEIDGEIYKGITKEKKKAALEYKQACKDKKNAILVSQDHDANTFKIQTNIQPGSKAVLNVTVEQLLVRTFGYYELSLDISNIDNDFVSKSKMIPVRINLTDSNDITDIEIPFGEYSIVDDTVNTKRINAKISKQGQNALSYFIFRYTSKNEVNNQMLFDPKSKTFLHRFGYDMETNSNILPRRTVFVLDKSGSMWGIWDAAQEALIGAVANMKENDRFGVVLFDSNVYTKPIRQADKDAIDNTIEYLRTQEPGSATNLYGGIEAAMKLIIEDGGGNKGDEYVNQVVFVTDGVANVGVTNTDQILANMFAVNGKLAKPISVFGFGIGEDHGNNWVQYLNYPLIRQISIQNGGFDKRIKKSETKQDLEKYYKILESPQLSSIDVKYESSNYEINKLTQNKFSTLYSGTDIVICGKLETGFDGSIKTTIVTDQDLIQKEFALNDIIISYNENIDINVERIWAYLSLKNYENLLLQDRNNVDDVMRRLVNENALHLALTFKLVTQWTSMIVVEEKKVDQVDINGEDGIETLQTQPEQEYFEESAYVYSLSGYASGSFSYDSPTDSPTSGILLLDVTPLTLGIEGADGSMIKIIEKNSVIPTKKSINLTGNKLPQVNVSANNGMSGVIMRMFQGERMNVSDNIFLGDYILNGKYDKTINVEVTIEIDANGILNFATVDDINGRNDITISADQGRPSQEDIDEMLRAEEFAQHVSRTSEAVQAQNKLESAAYHLKNQLDDDEKLGGKLSEKDKDILYEAANDVIDWLDDNEDADRDDYKEKQQEFDDIVRPIVKDFYPEQGEDIDHDHEDL